MSWRRSSVDRLMLYTAHAFCCTQDGKSISRRTRGAFARMTPVRSAKGALGVSCMQCLFSRACVHADERCRRDLGEATSVDYIASRQVPFQNTTTRDQPTSITPCVGFRRACVPWRVQGRLRMEKVADRKWPSVTAVTSQSKSFHVFVHLKTWFSILQTTSIGRCPSNRHS